MNKLEAKELLFSSFDPEKVKLYDDNFDIKAYYECIAEARRVLDSEVKINRAKLFTYVTNHRIDLLAVVLDIYLGQATEDSVELFMEQGGITVKAIE